jgi:hypothetical protein
MDRAGHGPGSWVTPPEGRPKRRRLPNNGDLRLTAELWRVMSAILRAGSPRPTPRGASRKSELVKSVCGHDATVAQPAGSRDNDGFPR